MKQVPDGTEIRGPQSRRRLKSRIYVGWLALVCIGLVAAVGWMSTQAAAPGGGGSSSTGGWLVGGVRLWTPLLGEKFSMVEKVALCANIVIALAGLGYALMLVGQVKNAPDGTKKMQEMAQAVREGANAYLYRQFRVVFALIVVITILLFYAAKASGLAEAYCWGRALAFLLGSTFSATVGFVGMRLATVGNLRVAAAAKTSFGRALQLGYRTDTITGMLTDGLGLLGGSLIFLIYGEQAYEALLGFGFGGTLLALFMRVGGGIYTKAADVRRRSGRQSRGRHPRGRSPQCGHDRRQRGRQRSRLRRHGGRHLRELRSDYCRGHDPRHRQLRAQGRDLPVAGSRDRRDGEHHQHLQRAGGRQGLGRRGHEVRQPRLHHRLLPEHPGLHPAGAGIPEFQYGRDDRPLVGALHSSLSAGSRRLPWRDRRQRDCRPSDLGDTRHFRPRHACCLDLPDRHHSGGVPQ